MIIAPPTSNRIAPPTTSREPHPPPTGSPTHLQQEASPEESSSSSPLASSSVESNTTAPEGSNLTDWLRYVLLAAEDRRSRASPFSVLFLRVCSHFLFATPFLELEAASHPVALCQFFLQRTAVTTGKLQT